MAQRKLAITLTESEIQQVERAVVDRDRDAALEFVEKVVKPQIDATLNRGHCRPVFELERGKDPSAIRPPPAPAK